jgi:hypothetical protein
VHIVGEAQLAAYWLLGRRFCRTSGAALYGHNEHFGSLFSTEGIPKVGISGGKHQCVVVDEELGLSALETYSTVQTVGLMLGRIRASPHYLSPVREELAQRCPGVPLFAIDTEAYAPKGIYTTNGEVHAFVADVVALLHELAGSHKTRDVYLYVAIANNVLAVLASCVDPHCGVDIHFMEYCSDDRVYVELSMPRGS